MLRRDIIRALAATPLAGWLRPWTSVAFVSAFTEDLNAADLYRTVFGWERHLLPGDSERLRNAVTSDLDDENIDRLIQKAGSALDAIRKAASLNRCDWESEVLSAEDLGKDQLSHSNVNLVRMACLSARRHARSGRGGKALDDIFAALTLAHRIGTGGLLIARVLEGAGEAVAFRTLARLLPEFDHATLADLSRRLDTLPSPAPASTMIGPELRFILSTIRGKLEEFGPVIEGDQWGELGYDAEEAAALERLTGGDRARLLDHLETNGPAFDELARRLDLPRPGCRASLDEFARTERSLHPIAAGLVESAWGARHMVDRMNGLRAILRAGLAMICEGEAAFRRVPDPFGNGPFSLERRGKAYLIRSALLDEGRPEVSLEIGDTR